jgi:hypothetical protein
VLAVDGKTVRCARAAGRPAPHLLACPGHATGTVLAQVAAGSKTNEITMLAGLPGQLSDLDGALVTMDALHAQRDHATWLHERGARYLVTVKGNQPGLLRRPRAGTGPHVMAAIRNLPSASSAWPATPASPPRCAVMHATQPAHTAWSKAISNGQ